MKSLEAEHAQVVVHLKAIKKIAEEMRDEGLGGDDFEGLYLQNKLVPVIREIFKP